MYGDRGTSCLHFGSIDWLSGLTQVRNTTPHHFWLQLLGVKSQGICKLEAQGPVLANEVVNASGQPSPVVATVYEAWLFHPCLLEKHSEKSIAAPSFDEAFKFPYFLIAASSVCCIFNSEGANVELR